jgi:hypothetical protein
MKVKKFDMKGIIKDEKGHALVLALILLLISGLIIASLLSFMGTGLIVGEVHERRTAELYAADAGVEDAVWEIRRGIVPALRLGRSTNYTIPNVNNKTVAVTITLVRNETGRRTYRVTSIATTGNKSHTTVVAHVNATLRHLFDNAITSQGNMIIQPGSTVIGDVQHGGNLTNQGTINGTETPGKFPNWPNATALSNHFLSQVQGAPDPGSPIDIGGQTINLPRSHRRGHLDIQNTGGANGTLVLNGTLYVDGNLDFKQPGSEGAYTINLNGQTIFVTGTITFPAHRVSISGSGAIIAIGDITFQPAMQSREGDFVFVMSVQGMVRFQPRGTFYGSLAGHAEVRLQPGCTLIWRPLGGTILNFPIDQHSVVGTATITTWEVSQH